MSRPGIILAFSGLHFAIKRLEEAQGEHKAKPSSTTESKVVRAGCETLFWLFSLNEDFAALIRDKANIDIHSWWKQSGIAGRQMNGLRLIRNRITHAYTYYWQVWDLGTMTWSKIDPPTPDELLHSPSKHLPGQFADYQSTLVGQDIVNSLKGVAQIVLNEAVKYDLTTW